MPEEIQFRSDMTVDLVRASAEDADVLFAARVSTDDQQDPTLSLPRQLANCQKALPEDMVVALHFYDVESGRTNPFLHLSMHLSISEQVSIDQPRGIKQAFGLLAAKRGSAHEAQHEVMECLGEMMWESQRSGLPPDGDKYIDSVRRRATRD